MALLPVSSGLARNIVLRTRRKLYNSATGNLPLLNKRVVVYSWKHMKLLQSVLASTLFVCLVQTYPVAAAREEEDVICPDSNPLNCYPRLFIPTKEWQTVKEGQVIPAGLDVRLDLENMNREARLADTTGKGRPGNTDKNHELVVLNGDAGFLNSLDFVKKWANMQLTEPPAFAEVTAHLEVLVDWSSDRESGVMIAQNVQPLIKLSGLYNSKKTKHNTFGLTEAQYLQVQEMTYRILSSSFRNNIEAQEKLLAFLNEPEAFLQHLVVGDELAADLVVNRKLGLLGSLLNNHIFSEYFDRGGVEAELIILYTKVESPTIRQRILNILEDRRLVKRGTDDVDDAKSKNDNNSSEDTSTSLDGQIARIAQDKLIKTSLASNPQSREVLEGLGVLKRQNKNAFRADHAFLDWMDKQINLERDQVKRLRKREVHDDVQLEESSQFLEELIELRHEVFGNPLGSRKEFLDEL